MRLILLNLLCYFILSSTFDFARFLCRLYYIFSMNELRFPYRTGGVSSRKQQSTNRVSYKKFQLIRVLPSDDDDVLDIEAMAEEPGVQVWMPIRLNKTADLVLPPGVARDAKRFLTNREIDFVVLSSDLEVRCIQRGIIFGVGHLVYQCAGKCFLK